MKTTPRNLSTTKTVSKARKLPAKKVTKRAAPRGK